MNLSDLVRLGMFFLVTCSHQSFRNLIRLPTSKNRNLFGQHWSPFFFLCRLSSSILVDWISEKPWFFRLIGLGESSTRSLGASERSWIVLCEGLRDENAVLRRSLMRREILGRENAWSGEAWVRWKMNIYMAFDVMTLGSFVLPFTKDRCFLDDAKVLQRVVFVHRRIKDGGWTSKDFTADGILWCFHVKIISEPYFSFFGKMVTGGELHYVFLSVLLVEVCLQHLSLQYHFTTSVRCTYCLFFLHGKKCISCLFLSSHIDWLTFILEIPRASTFMNSEAGSTGDEAAPRRRSRWIQVEIWVVFPQFCCCVMAKKAWSHSRMCLNTSLELCLSSLEERCCV